MWGYNINGPRSHLGPWLFWSLSNSSPKKFSLRMKIIIWDLHARANILKVQIFLGPKSHSPQMRSRTISVIAKCDTIGGPYFSPEIYIPDIGVMLFCRLVLLLFDELFCSRGVSLHSGQLPWLPSWHCVLVCGLILDITICFCID